jgi:hypothetical protein
MPLRDGDLFNREPGLSDFPRELVSSKEVMAHLEDLTPSASVKGILPDSLVNVDAALI